MSINPRPTVLEMTREAIVALGGESTAQEMREWIEKKYPGTNRSTISCQIVVATVNNPTRKNFKCNQKPRMANGKYDFLYHTESGNIKLYNPDEHGQWEIIEDENGDINIWQVGILIPECPTEPRGFAAENHLRDYLANNLDDIEDGLKLYADDNGNIGVEFQTEIGRIDILAVDKRDQFVVIELKVHMGSDRAVGQILRYISWIKRHKAEGKPVRGLIIARHISKETRYASADIECITLKEYDLKVELRDVLKSV
jgi:endonuclease